MMSHRRVVMKEASGFGEKACKQIMLQLISAVALLHSQKVMHRNLQLDSIKLDYAP